MFISYIVVTLITIAANAGMVIADFSRSKMVLANGAEVGVPESWVPLLGTLKAAGAAGLLLGLLGFRLIGIAAAVGLTLFFIGAVAAHVRAKVYYNLAFPGGYLALAVASLVFAVAVADL
jgi:hypothetical protein